MSTFDKTRFKPVWVNQDQMYTIGYDEQTKERVIAVTISWIGWYDIYFELTEEEYGWHKSDIAALDDLAARLAIDKGQKFYSNRLLFSEGPTV